MLIGTSRHIRQMLIDDNGHRERNGAQLEASMRFLIRTSLLAAAFIVLASGSARASTFEVKVPFPFLIHGHAMPAGQYVVKDDGGVVLFNGEKGTHGTMVIVTTPVSGHDPAGSSPALTFQHDENQYRLTNIWESATQGREISKH
jgi:hypothetical protein